MKIKRCYLLVWIFLTASTVYAQNPPAAISETTDPVVTVVESPEAELAKQQLAEIDNLIERIWTTKVSLSVSDVPLEEVMLQIAKQLGCELRIDDRSLEDLGLTREIPISIDVKNLAVGSVLELVLGQVDITYLVEPNRLVVLSVGESDDRKYFLTRFYPVDQWLGDGKCKLNLEKVRAIVLMIEAYTWEEMGGPGSCEIYGDGLLITQPATFHDRIRRLFSAMMKAKSLPNDSYQVASIPTHPLGEQADKLRRKIERQLISAKWRDVPLGEVAKLLEEQLDLKVIIDQRGLEDIRLDESTPVNGTWNEASVATLLNDMTRNLDLGWRIKGDYLEITSFEELEASLEVRVYPVRDLAPSVSLLEGADKLETYIGGTFCGVGVPNRPSVPRELELPTPKQRLIEMIEWQIVPDAWEELGGVGALLPCEASDTLVVSQVGWVNTTLESLLQDLRQTKRIAAEEAYRQQAAEVILMTYSIPATEDKPRFSSMDIGLLAQRLTRDIAPDAWGEGRSIQALSNRLIIRQRRDIQRAIYQHLVEIGYFKFDRTEAGLGGGGIDLAK
ncbi:hypothetical protein [Bremerella cremea]|nr:hypothetical protein [Bremerella cremea]